MIPTPQALQPKPSTPTAKDTNLGDYLDGLRSSFSRIIVALPINGTGREFSETMWGHEIPCASTKVRLAPSLSLRRTGVPRP